MLKLQKAFPPFGLVAFTCIAAGYILGSAFSGQQVHPEVRAAETNLVAQNNPTANGQAKPTTNNSPTISPTKARADRDTYYPNTEDLAPDEMRVVACGTGMPTTRAFQAAACFLVELGNGDKFLFDCGSGAAERISSLQIPYNEYAKDADLVIHECFIAVPDLVAKMRFTPESALKVGTQVHTAPEAFGKVMSQVKPRMAVAYHFFKDFDTAAAVHDRIRKTYDGPLSLAEDFMVWNITKDAIKTRMAVTEEHTWSPPLASPAQAPRPDDKQRYAKLKGIPVESLEFSDFTKSGYLDVDDVLRPIYKEASSVVGQEFPYPGDQ